MGIMSNSYSSLCDDFFIDTYINTELDLPNDRHTVLDFFERIQKQFPSMASFQRRDNGELCLEEDRESGQYRWVSIELDRIGAGYANPPNFEDAYRLDRLVIDLAPYMLGVSSLDTTSLDVTFAMDFNYSGNHDEIIAEALFESTAFGCLLDCPNAKPVGFSPAVVTALSEDCRTQARISVESKTSCYEIRNRKYSSDESISLYFTIRQYPRPDEKFDALKSFDYQCSLAEQLMAEKIIPNFVMPLANTIAQKR